MGQAFWIKATMAEIKDIGELSDDAPPAVCKTPPKATGAAKAQAKGGMKRPAARSASSAQDGTEAVAKAQASMKRPATSSSSVLDKDTKGGAKKRPAAAVNKNKAWKYLYHEDIVWVRSLLKRSYVYGMILTLMQCLTHCVVLLWNQSVSTFCEEGKWGVKNWKKKEFCTIRPGPGITEDQLQEIAVLALDV